MIYSTVKVIAVTVIFLAALAALVFFNLDPVVGVPIITAAIGYVAGNSQFTDNRPIVDRQGGQ